MTSDVSRTLIEVHAAIEARLLRQCWQALDGPLSVLVLGRRPREVSEIAAHFDGARTAVVSDAPSPMAFAALTDHLLQSHAVIWCTPCTAPLSASERETLRQLEASGVPAQRWVALAGTRVLDAMSDDPSAELAQIAARVHALATGWSLVTDVEIDALAQELLDTLEALRPARQAAVTRDLISRVIDTLTTDRRVHLERIQQLEAEQASEAAARDEHHARLQRAETHVTATLQRRSRELVIQLRAFLHELEAALPQELAAAPNLGAARQALPHWLDHVVERWLETALSDWRADVLRDVADIPGARELLTGIALLPPALHPPPVRDATRWGRRVGLTASVGAGLALGAFGLWVPAALIAGGGVAWSALSRSSAEPASREALLSAATLAVREMGRSAEQVIEEQLLLFRSRLHGTADRAALDSEQEGAPERDALSTRIAIQRARVEEVDAHLESLRAVVGPVEQPD